MYVPVGAQLCVLVPHWGGQPAGGEHSEPVSHTEHGGYPCHIQLVNLRVRIIILPLKIC